MKRLRRLLCLPMLLWLLPSCSGEYSKDDFLPHRDAFLAVADYAQTLYAATKDADFNLSAEEERQLVLRFDRKGTTFYNMGSDKTIPVPASLQMIHTFSVSELRVMPDGIYFWVEGYNNGIVYTAHRCAIRKKVAHRLYRLAKNWYCIGEHYM